MALVSLAQKWKNWGKEKLLLLSTPFLYLLKFVWKCCPRRTVSRGIFKTSVTKQDSNIYKKVSLYREPWLAETTSFIKEGSTGWWRKADFQGFASDGAIFQQ